MITASARNPTLMNLRDHLVQMTVVVVAAVLVSSRVTTLIALKWQQLFYWYTCNFRSSSRSSSRLSVKRTTYRIGGVVQSQEK